MHWKNIKVDKKFKMEELEKYHPAAQFRLFLSWRSTELIV